MVQIGDRLFIKSPYGFNGYATVSWVGRKYFKFKEIDTEKFNVNDFVQFDRIGKRHSYSVYRSEESYLEHQAQNSRKTQAHSLHLELRAYFLKSPYSSSLSLEQLQQIKTILEGEKNERP